MRKQLFWFLHNRNTSDSIFPKSNFSTISRWYTNHTLSLLEVWLPPLRSQPKALLLWTRVWLNCFLNKCQIASSDSFRNCCCIWFVSVSKHNFEIICDCLFFNQSIIWKLPFSSEHFNGKNCCQSFASQLWRYDGIKTVLILIYLALRTQRSPQLEVWFLPSGIQSKILYWRRGSEKIINVFIFAWTFDCQKLQRVQFFCFMLILELILFHVWKFNSVHPSFDTICCIWRRCLFWQMLNFTIVPKIV